MSSSILRLSALWSGSDRPTPRSGTGTAVVGDGRRKGDVRGVEDTKGIGGVGGTDSAPEANDFCDELEDAKEFNEEEDIFGAKRSLFFMRGG